MSEEVTQILQTEHGQMLTAEYKDGQLQIVEVSSFDKDNETHILPDLPSDETRYVQVLDGEKGVVHLDLLSLIKQTVVASYGSPRKLNTPGLLRCGGEDDQATYQVVGTSDDGDTTFTCVIADTDDDGSRGKNHRDNESQESYVVVDTEQNKEPLLYVQSSLQQIRTQQRLRNQGNVEQNKPLTPEEIVLKAKLLEKTKNLNLTPSNTRGRKRKSDLPPPMDLLTSPGFKLYLYSCKYCNYKCNAMPDMSKHRATHNVKKAGSARGSGSLQCPKCPFKATSHSQLVLHESRTHLKTEIAKKIEALLPDADSGDDSSTLEVLVCGGCGFESSSRPAFRRHVQSAHSLTLPVSLSAIAISDDNSHASSEE